MMMVMMMMMVQTMGDIFKSGYSRIPIYGQDKNDIVGLILAKDLICIDPEVCDAHAAASL